MFHNSLAAFLPDLLNCRVQVGPGRDDDSAAAFQQFRRGVTRNST